MSEDTPLAASWANIRTLRLADGPDEVHRRAIARHELKKYEGTKEKFTVGIKELFDLTGKTAIITGGGRGLGEQIADCYAEAGANIVLCSRKAEACEEAAKS